MTDPLDGIRREAASDDLALAQHATAQERARRAWRTRRAIAAGERPPMRRARARCSVVDGPFAGKTLLLERELVAADEWAVPGAVYRFADSPGGRLAYIANSDPFLPVIGWRGWHFAREEVGKAAYRMLPMLQSGFGGIRWPGGAPFGATCGAEREIESPISATPVKVRLHDAPAPVWDCSCGIYSTLTHHALESAGHGFDEIVGLLAGWGRVIEHAEGYRFQRAYPVLLAATSTRWRTGLRSIVRDLRATYAVPVAATGPEDVHERIADYVASPRADLPEWVYRALPPDLRAAGLEHERLAKKEKRNGQ